MAKYGNTSVSALVSGANAARTKQVAYNDQAAAYQYQNSYQTADDYKAYQSYLNDRIGTTVDPSRKLSLQGTANSAFSSYTGNEIQRQSQDVMSGQGNDSAKLDTIAGFIKQAQQSGNYNLAQNLTSQYMSLSQTIQNQQAASSAKAMAGAVKGVHQALSAQDAQHNIFQTANLTGKPLTDPTTGNMIKFNDATGQYENSDTPHYVTAREAAGAKAANYMQKQNIYQTAISNGLDETGAFQSEMNRVAGTEDFIKSTSPALLADLQNGDNTFTNKYDPTTQTSSPTMRTPTSFTTDKNGTAVPLYNNGFSDTSSPALTGNKPVDMSFNRTMAADPTAPIDNYTVGTAQVMDSPNSPNKFNRSFQDPITHKLDYTNIDPNSIFPVGGHALSTKNNSLQFNASDAQAGKKPGLMSDLQNFDFGAAAAPDYASNLINGANSATKFIGNGILGIDGKILHATGADQLLHLIPGVDALMNNTNQAASARAASINAAKAYQANPNNLRVQQIAQTPSLSVKPIASTPSLSVQPINTQPSLSVKPIATTPNITVKPVQTQSSLSVSGPRPAPAPQSSSQWWNPTSWFK